MSSFSDAQHCIPEGSVLFYLKTRHEIKKTRKWYKAWMAAEGNSDESSDPNDSPVSSPTTTEVDNDEEPHYTKCIRFADRHRL